MKTQLKTFAFLMLVIFPGIFSAQTIKGKVVDETDVLPFVNITIIKNNDQIKTGTTTDENGLFSIKVDPGTYDVEVSFVGYSTIEKRVSVENEINLGTIKMKPDEQSLNEIVLVSERRIIEQEIDRLVFNVEKSIASTGGNGMDVLKITPGIQVRNNTLEILGKGATQVMINGRISPLQGDELTSLLNGISASDIKKIEVITNPPAKYESSGNGGLINIVLKKGIQNSWKNSTTLSYHQNRFNYGALNNNFFFNKDKISLSASINATKGNVENLEGLLINYPSNFWDIDVNSKLGKDQFSGRLLIDYNLSDNTTVGVQYLGNNTEPNIMATTSSIFDNADNLERKLVNRGDNIVDNQNHSLNFHAMTQLDSLGKSISFDADYFTFNSENSRDFFNEEFNNSGVSQGINSAALNISNQEIENFSSKIDVDFPINRINLSYGVKTSFTNTISDVLYYDKTSGSEVLDPNRSNAFQYRENVLAGYISGNTKLNEKIQMQFGLRLEDTKTKGINEELGQETSNKYTKLFPTFYISYAKNDNNNFAFTYGRRIDRPNFRNLNPFRFYINANSYSVGNPFLQPSFSDNLEFSHMYKRKLNSSIFLSITTDGSGTVFTSDAENQTQIITRENYFKQYNYGIKESFSFTKLSWLKSQNSINVIGYHTEFTKDFGTTPKNGVQINLTTNNTIPLNDKTKLQVNSYYSTQHNRGLFSIGEMFDLSLGLQHNFSNSLTMSLLLNDIFNTASLNNYISSVNGIEQIFRQNTSSRNARISLSYEFGNKKVNVKNRGFGNDEEQKRSN
jgi:hypothetical protein